MAHAASHLKKTRDEVLPAKPVVTLTRADTQKALQANGESETTEEGEAKGRRSSGKQRRRKSGGTAGLLRAARAGNVEKVLELLNLGGDVNTRNEAGLTALHLAAKEGHAVIVSELLQRDADVAAATKLHQPDGGTPNLINQEANKWNPITRRGSRVQIESHHSIAA
uniref:ankyrin-3-like n=1 Tax=Myxine glutinosa TaxID=7769 RepID=UPI00358F2253